MQAMNIVDKACVGIMIVSKVYLKPKLGFRELEKTIGQSV